MFKIKFLIILIIVVYVLDKLYLLPLYVALDSKPDSRRSATYLAKSIAKEAKCEDTWLLDINYIEGDTTINFDCVFDTFINLTIYVFLNGSARDEKINNLNKDSYFEICFKQGARYMICENGSLPNKIGKPIFSGQKYYKQFPGENITFLKD
jgi:hypothetical protein